MDERINQKFLNMVGLCARAGKCLYGETACLSGIRANKVRLMLIDSAASENTRKRFADACAFRGVPCVFFSEDVASAAGKPGRKLIAVADQNFASALLKLQGSLPNTSEGESE